MASHCPICDSTNIEQRTAPSGRLYWHCNSCNKNFTTPIYDPLSTATDATSTEATASAESATTS